MVGTVWSKSQWTDRRLIGSSLICYKKIDSRSSNITSLTLGFVAYISYTVHLKLEQKALVGIWKPFLKLRSRFYMTPQQEGKITFQLQENTVVADRLIEIWDSIKIVRYWEKLPKSKQPASKSFLKVQEAVNARLLLLNSNFSVLLAVSSSHFWQNTKPAGQCFLTCMTT